MGQPLLDSEDTPCLEMRTLEGPAPELGHSYSIYRVCSISLFYALIIHIMRTFFTALVISIHMWFYCIA